MSFIRKVSHQIIGEAPLYNVMQQSGEHAIGSSLATTNLQINPAVSEEVAKLGIPVDPKRKGQSTQHEQKQESPKEFNIGTMTPEDSKAATAKIHLGSYADIERLEEEYKWGDVSEDSPLGRLPHRIYFMYAPVIGKMRYNLGNPEVVTPHPVKGKEIMDVASAATHLLSKLDKPSEIDWNEIAIAIKHNHAVNRQLVLALADSMARSPMKAILFAKAKPILSQLVKLGATYPVDRNNSTFRDLVNYGLDSDALTLAIAEAGLNGSPTPVVLGNPLLDPSFGNFAEVALLCVPKGADINAVRYCNESFGSFLHMYLGYEYPETVKLIGFLDSLHKANLPKSQFNFEALDGYGRTPLLLAINIRQEDAALALLDLHVRKNIKVGIDIADPNGVTPLLLAAALGLKDVVKKLLELGASPHAKDTNGHGLDYYANLKEKETAALLSPVMQPYRCNSTFVTPDGKREAWHSHLYWKDPNRSPACLYKKGEEEKTGDAQYPHLVVLSTHKDYVGRVEEAIACARKSGDKVTADYFQQQYDDIKGTKSVVTMCLEAQGKVRQLLQTESIAKIISDYNHVEEEKNVSIPCVGPQANAFFEKLSSTLDNNPHTKGPLIKKNADGKVLLPKFWLEQLHEANPTAIDELSREFNCPKEMLNVTPRR